VIEYRPDPQGGRAPAPPEGKPPGDTGPTYRLLTSPLNPGRAPAHELAELYLERWEIAHAFDELKTHRRGPKAVLRSKTPTGAVQEAHGLLLRHYAIRSIMHEAALQTDLDTDCLSFLRSLRAARKSVRQQAGLSPEAQNLALLGVPASRYRPHDYTNDLTIRFKPQSRSAERGTPASALDQNPVACPSLRGSEAAMYPCSVRHKICAPPKANVSSTCATCT